MNTPNALIVGGSSGLGRELSLLLREEYRTFIVGRHDPGLSRITFSPLDLSVSNNELAVNLDSLVARMPELDLVVYAAGFRQEAGLDELTDSDLEAMNNVGLLAPAMLLRRILRKQGRLKGLITVTSTSQWTPRAREPMYTAVKAGLGMLANSLALDTRFGKVLVAGPGGMVTEFWAGSTRDTTGMLDPQWVAREILELYKGDYKYKFVRIFRNPQRIELAETR